MSRYLQAAVLMLVAAMAGCLPRPAQAQAIDEYEYVPDRIYPVRTGLGITTQIELSPDEEILDYSSGFSSGWDLVRRGHVFYLKPRNVDVDTNLMVRTKTYAYIFELKVVATDWTELEQAKRAGVQYRIRFRYPPDTRFSASAAATDMTPELDIGLDKDRSYHFGYDYSTRGDDAWLVPSNVYDDGRFTYIRMNPSPQLPTGNFPAVFGREEADGEDFVVNTTVEANTLVVHGTYPYLVIRHGRNVVGLRRRFP